MEFVLIGAGGALGSIARFAVGEWLTRETSHLPWGTLAVNIVGACLLGILVTALQDPIESRQLRLLFGVGFLGAFTTFSTFSLEIVRIAQASGWSRGAGYAGLSLLLGVAGVGLGLWIGQTLRTG